MSKKEKKGRNDGLWSEIVIMVLLIGLSMMLGIRLYCKDWLDAINCAIWIACWIVWYRIWKSSMRHLHEKRHIEDKVAEYCGVKDLEAIAYLAGFLASHFNKFEQIIMNSDVPER